MAGVIGKRGPNCPTGHKGQPGPPGRPTRQQPEIEEDSGEITTIPQLDELQVEISTSGPDKGIKLKDLWANVDPNSNPNLCDPTFIKRDAGPDQDMDQFLQDFQREAGTLRNDIPNRED